MDIRFEPAPEIRLDLRKIDVVSVSETLGRRLVVSGGKISLVNSNERMNGIRVVYRAKFGGGLRRKDDAIYTAFQTTDWMPVHFAPHDRASFRVTLTMPTGYRAVAPGRRVSHREEGGQVKAVYELDRASAAYTLGFAAGRFDEHVAELGGTEYRILHKGFTQEELHALVEKADSAISFFSSLSGIPHPSRSFAQIWLVDRVAQELVDMATMNVAMAESMFKDPEEDWLLVHEISHQWWGNSVTCAAWSDFWLNEAFATFMVAAYKERVWGRPNYDREIELARKRFEKLKEAEKDGPLKLRTGADVSEAGGPVPYVKGILLLDELRTRMGDTAFWAGVRTYTKAHWFGSATSEDFESAMQNQTQVDVRESFARWGAR